MAERIPNRKRAISLVGAGNLAAALSGALARAGYRMEEIVARDLPESRRRARALAQRAGASAVTVHQARLTSPLVWICVTDDAIASTAQVLAAREDVDWAEKVVLHSSGALSSDELGPLRRLGAAVASAHPMMTFVRGAEPDFRGVPLAVEGDRAAVAVARRVGRNLGCELISVPKQGKVLYHVAGSFASPMVVAVLDIAGYLACRAGIGETSARKLILPILKQTVRNFELRGAAGAFSGPLNRGDLETIRKHLAALRATPEARKAFIALARWAARRLPVQKRKELLRMMR